MNLPPPRKPPSRVQAGRRPAVILHSDAVCGQVPLTLIVPGTSKLKASGFPNTVTVQASTTNGLSRDTVFLGFQVMPVDDSLLVWPELGELSPDDLQAVEAAVRGALGL